MSGPSLAPERVRVELGARGYDIVVGREVFEHAAELVRPLLARPRVFVLTDETVAAAQWPRLERALNAGGIETSAIVVPPGEGSKDLNQLGHVLETLIERRIERSDVLLAVGGGVIGDLGGLAAGLALRGIDYVQVPTTLLSQVDSSVGGKTAINSRHGKNLIGVFHQPVLVLSDLDTLATLPRRELLAGYAEIVKYGLINDPDFFAWLESFGAALVAGDVSVRQRAVIISCRNKARVVAADERETGERALLNLGHTFGHALEAACGFGAALLHGEAVAIGMVMAFDLSVKLGLCPPKDAARVRRHLALVGLPTRPPAGADWSADRLMDLIARDKKVRAGQATFVVARGIGRSFLSRDIDPGEVRALLLQSVAA